MSDNLDPPEYRDPPAVTGHHFCITRFIWFDSRDNRGIGVRGLCIHLEPEDGNLFPIRFERLFAYFQLVGDEGDYRPHVRLVKIVSDEHNEEVEVQIGRDGEPREYHLGAGLTCQISGFNYREEFAFAIGPVPIREAGLYEFQLFLEGFDGPMARERVLAREYRNDESPGEGGHDN